MVSVQAVSKSFGKLKAVDQLSLELAKGSFTALLGPNGAGKTTLVEMIEGLQQPDSGSISIAGMNWQQHNAQLRRLIGLSLQETRFIDKLTVYETLRLFASFYGIGKKRTNEVMAMVQLTDKHNSYTVHLSGGQRQRLALAIAILHAPQLLVLDEPTTGLDPNARRELWQLLEQLKQSEQLTLLLTTHYLEEAEHLCERIVMMNKGKIIADGSLPELLSRFDAGERIEIDLLTQTRAPQFWQETLGVIRGLRKMTVLPVDEGVRVQMEVERIAASLPLLMATIEQLPAKLQHLNARRKTLDDLFAIMTGQRLEDV
ncbi:MAG: ABC transporter ATP-binding protein [Cytophagales bacterium]|nr:ABC transporter ATP-binding protein [Cytophagales bacterium]